MDTKPPGYTAPTMASIAKDLRVEIANQENIPPMGSPQWYSSSASSSASHSTYKSSNYMTPKPPALRALAPLSALAPLKVNTPATSDTSSSATHKTTQKLAMATPAKQISGSIVAPTSIRMPPGELSAAEVNARSPWSDRPRAAKSFPEDGTPTKPFLEARVSSGIKSKPLSHLNTHTPPAWKRYCSPRTEANASGPYMALTKLSTSYAPNDSLRHHDDVYNVTKSSCKEATTPRKRPILTKPRGDACTPRKVAMSTRSCKALNHVATTIKNDKEIIRATADVIKQGDEKGLKPRTIASEALQTIGVTDTPPLPAHRRSTRNAYNMSSPANRGLKALHAKVGPVKDGKLRARRYLKAAKDAKDESNADKSIAAAKKALRETSSHDSAALFDGDVPVPLFLVGASPLTADNAGPISVASTAAAEPPTEEAPPSERSSEGSCESSSVALPTVTVQTKLQSPLKSGPSKTLGAGLGTPQRTGVARATSHSAALALVTDFAALAAHEEARRRVESWAPNMAMTTEKPKPAFKNITPAMLQARAQGLKSRDDPSPSMCAIPDINSPAQVDVPPSHRAPGPEGESKVTNPTRIDCALSAAETVIAGADYLKNARLALKSVNKAKGGVPLW